MTTVLVAAFLAAAAPDPPRPPGPSRPIDARVPAGASPRVQIESQAGSIRVTGWDKPEVAVTGSLGPGAGDLQLDGKNDRISIEVEAEDHQKGAVAELEIHVPRGASLEIESFTATIAVSEVAGGISAESVNGSVTVAGAAGEVDAETVAGEVEISGRPSRVKAESVNGRVRVQGVRGEVEASSVNGAVEVLDVASDRVGLESVSGSIRFEGELGPSGRLTAESVSGNIDLALPAATPAAFSASSFSGAIESQLGGGTARAEGGGPGESLEFTIGAGSARVSIETLSGKVTLRKR